MKTAGERYYESPACFIVGIRGDPAFADSPALAFGLLFGCELYVADREVFLPQEQARLTACGVDLPEVEDVLVVAARLQVGDARTVRRDGDTPHDGTGDGRVGTEPLERQLLGVDRCGCDRDHG